MNHILSPPEFAACNHVVYISAASSLYQVSSCVSLTRVAHKLPGDLLVAAAATEDLSTQSAVVTPTESGELLIAVVTLFALAVRHPVLLQIAVLKCENAKLSRGKKLL